MTTIEVAYQGIILLHRKPDIRLFFDVSNARVFSFLQRTIDSYDFQTHISMKTICTVFLMEYFQTQILMVIRTIAR